MAHADEQDGGHTERGGDSHPETVAAFEPGEADPGPHALARAVDEPLGLTGLLPERLHHPQRPECLLHDRQRRALEPLRAPPLAAHAPPIDARQDEERRRNRQGDERELPVEVGGDRDHRREGDRRRREGNGALDHDVLDRQRVVLDPVEGVGRSLRVVVREGQALDLVHESRPEIEDQPLPDPGAQERTGDDLQLTDRRDDHKQANREQQDRGGRVCDGGGEERAQEGRQGARAEDRVHHELERQRIEKRHRACEEPQPERAREVEPVWARLPQQPPGQRDLAHQAPPSRSRPRPRAIVAMAAVHCSNVRSAASRATRPRIAAAGQARS